MFEALGDGSEQCPSLLKDGEARPDPAQRGIIDAIAVQRLLAMRSKHRLDEAKLRPFIIERPRRFGFGKVGSSRLGRAEAGGAVWKETKMRSVIFALAAIVVAPFAIDQTRAADRLPAFDIDRNCKLEAEGTGIASDSCTRDERDAKDQLAKNWSGFSASQKRACVGESSVGGDQSYVELLTCLEMASGGHFSTKQ